MDRSSYPHAARCFYQVALLATIWQLLGKGSCTATTKKGLVEFVCMLIITRTPTCVQLVHNAENSKYVHVHCMC